MTTSKQSEELVGKKLQDSVRRLISEEYYAYQLYLFSRLAVKSEDRGAIFDLFVEIAEDELDDHMNTLIGWCNEYGVDIPCTEREFKKYASPAISKQVSDLKKGKDAAYYLSEAVKSEEAAIASYKKVLELPEVHEFTDLQSAFWKIFYDENEHLQNLKTARIAYDANDDLIIG